MPQFDIVFEKLEELIGPDDDTQAAITITSRISVDELDEIEELRRFSAEIQEPDPLSYTTT